MSGTEAGLDKFDEFDEFVVARGAALLRTAYLLTGDRHMAEDLVQAALAKTFRHWSRVRDGSPEAYVRQVMVRENITWWRRRRIVETPVADVPERSASGVGADVDRRVSLDAALRHLSAQQRAVLVLRYYDDLTARQAADALGCSVGTVKTQAHRALKRLREVAPELVDLWDSSGEVQEVRR